MCSHNSTPATQFVRRRSRATSALFVTFACVAALPAAVARRRHGGRHEHSEHRDRRLLDRRHAGFDDARTRAPLHVAEIVNVTIALQSPTISVAAGATQRSVAVSRHEHAATAPRRSRSTGDSVLVGDDFDPTPAAPFIYFDSDASGDLSPADVPYVAGSNDPLLAADASVAVIVVNDIPAGQPDGDCGRSELRATADDGHRRAGHGVPGARHRRRRRRRSARAAAKRPCSASTSSATSRSPP